MEAINEAEVLRGVIITLTVSAETIDDFLDALMWVSHPKYAASASYWHKHLSPLRGGEHAMAIPFASFMSLAAALLACDEDDYVPNDWLRSHLHEIVSVIEPIAPRAAAEVRRVLADLR